MELYTLKINVTNQRLSFGENPPEIYSGDQSIDFVEFTFTDDTWNFPNIWAIFSRQKGAAYQIALDDNKVMIPAEVMQKRGYVYIGLMATDGENVQTSSVLQYSIRQGVANVETVTPSPSIYEQFLNDLEEYQEAIHNLETLAATAETLPAGSDATASYVNGVLQLGIPKGDTGATGNGIQSITKTGTSGSVDTYTITYTDGSTTTYTVTNGEVTQAELDSVIEPLEDDVEDLKNSLGFEKTLVSDGYYTMVNTGKDLNYLGQLVDNPAIDTSDYIDVFSIYDICRVVQNTTKYGMSSICYYTEDYSFIRRDLPGTNYNFDTFNGETVVWFNLDKTTPNIKYVRFNTEVSRGFQYRLVDEAYELHEVEEIAENSLTDIKTALDYEIAPETPTDYYTLVNTGKELNYLGQLADNSVVDTSDYISIDGLYDICRVVPNKTKYGMCTICYYDSAQNFIRRDLPGTSYEFSIYNGEDVVWFDIDKETPGIQYIRFSSENNRGFKYWVVENTPQATILDDYAKMPFSGKTIVNFGDSIFGQTRPPKDVSSYLAEKTGATVYNCGFGGCEMSVHADSNFDAFSMYHLADAVATNTWTLQETAAGASGMPAYFAETVDLLKTIDFSNVDIVTIGYGTNDWNNGTDLDNGGSSNKAYFADALRYSIETLLTAFPNLKIFVCTQTYRFFMDGSYNFIDDSNTHTNSHGKTLIDFVNKTIEVAEEYNVPHIDNYYIGMGKYSRSYYFYPTDGTHPNPEGNKLIAANMANKLF